MTKHPQTPKVSLKVERQKKNQFPIINRDTHTHLPTHIMDESDHILGFMSAQS